MISKQECANTKLHSTNSVVQADTLQELAQSSVHIDENELVPVHLF